jgi:hypothetical protein
MKKTASGQKTRLYLKLHHCYEISGFHYSATEVFNLLIYCTAQTGTYYHLPSYTMQHPRRAHSYTNVPSFQTVSY